MIKLLHEDAQKLADAQEFWLPEPTDIPEMSNLKTNHSQTQQQQGPCDRHVKDTGSTVQDECPSICQYMERANR